MKVKRTGAQPLGPRAYVAVPVTVENGALVRGPLANAIRIDGALGIRAARFEATARAAVFGWQGFALYFNPAAVEERAPIAIGLKDGLEFPKNPEV